MKTKTRNIILLLLISISIVELCAQETTQSGKFSIHNVTICPGWYNPILDYLNNNYLMETGTTNKFSGNYSIGGNLAFSLLTNFRARVGVSYWSDKVDNEGNYLFEEFKISFTRFSLAAIYEIKKDKFPLTPYVGLQGSFFTITNKFTHDNSSSIQQGQDYSWAPIIGLEKVYANHFIVGIEFLYHIGSYTQDVNIGFETTKQKVSINGPELIFKLGYKF